MPCSIVLANKKNSNISVEVFCERPLQMAADLPGHYDCFADDWFVGNINGETLV